MMCRRMMFFGFYLMILIGSKAQKRWDGEGGDSLWQNGLNWHPDGVPVATDDVLIDNAFLAGPIWINMGTDTAQIHSLTLRASGSFVNTVCIPTQNTKMPVLRVLSTGIGVDIGMNSKILNSSGAPAGNPIELNGRMAIRNGGSYIHHTARGNAYLAGKLLADTTTKRGSFIFDVPGNAGYTVSLTGRHYGSLHFLSSAGRKSYSGTGSSNLSIGGDLVIGDSASLTSSLTARIIICENLVVNGRFHFNPVTADSTDRLIEFAGDSGTISIKGTLEPGPNFRGFELSSGKLKLLSRLFLNTGTTFFAKTGTKLDLDTCTIRGSGTMRLASGALAMLAHEMAVSDGSKEAGIMTTTRVIDVDAGFRFTGSGNQFTGNLFPDTIGFLDLSKVHGDLWLEKKLVILDSLLLHKGIIRAADSSRLDLMGTVIGGNALSFSAVPIQIKAVNTSEVFFPVGDSSLYAPLFLRSVNPRSFNCTVTFMANKQIPGDLNLRYPLKMLGRRGFWELILHQLAGNTTDSLRLSAAQLPQNITNLSEMPSLAMRELDSTYWKLPALQTTRDSNFVTTPFLPIQSSIWTFSTLLPIALPHQNIRVKSTVMGNSYALDWETDDPESIAVYHIEISEVRQNFRLFETVEIDEKKGLQSYVFQLNHRLSGKYFFRIRGIQKNGDSFTSNIVHLHFSLPIALYPNPGSDKVYISFKASEIKQSYLTDLRAARQHAKLEAHGNLTGFNIFHLRPGVYRLHLWIGEKWQVFSFVKY